MNKVLAEYQAEKFLKGKLPVAKSFLCKNLEAAKKASRKTGFPVVLKIISRDALHKTEIGGVLFPKDEKEFIADFNKLLGIVKKKKIRVEGILVQEFLTGKEVIIGIKKDQAFGHVVAFGIGGKYVEILKDVTFRVCPITNKDAEEMIDELKFGKMLFGARNEKPVNRKVLVSTLVKVSRLPIKNKKIQELDINPFIINEKKGKVCDARISFG